MPGRNGTGPMGAGPMTGRSAGYCAETPGFANSIGGGGLGRGMQMRRGVRGEGSGGGFGFRNRFYAPAAINTDQEKEQLANEVKILENELETVKKRLNELADK